MRAPALFCLFALPALTLTGCVTSQKDPVYQLSFQNRDVDVFATYPLGLTRAEAETQGRVIYMVESSKRLVPCNGTRSDCAAKLRNMEDRISELGTD